MPSYWHLGRRIPTDWTHVDKYPYRLFVAPEPFVVNRIMSLPWWHKRHDQSSEGSCVGHGIAMERAIANTRQNILANIPLPRTRRYNPIHIWNEAKAIDQWPDTNPGDSEGTSVSAAYDVVRAQGVQRVKGIKIVNGVVTPDVGSYTPDLAEGIAANRWATTVDDIRYAIKNASPVTIGVNWYSNFDTPQNIKNSLIPEYWIGIGNLGSLRGGHCVCIYGANDQKQGFKIKNSWGASYPQVWMPYDVMARLLTEYGEACLVTDK